MKHSSTGLKTLFMVVLALTFLVPMNVFARGSFYFDFKPGAYLPLSKGLDSFDPGFNGEIALGYQFNPFIAAEFGSGYFSTHGKRTFIGSTYVSQRLDIGVIPVALGFKAIVPYKKWEFFGLAGGGAYIVSGTYNVNDWDDHYDYYHHDHHDRYNDRYSRDYDDHDDDYDVVVGGYLGAGIHYNITPRIFRMKPKLFVGVEGKYLWTNKARLDFEEFGVPLRVRFKLDGILATTVIGIKF